MSIFDVKMEELNKLTPQEIKEKYQELKKEWYDTDADDRYYRGDVLGGLDSLACKLDKEDAQDLIKFIKEEKLLGVSGEDGLYCEQRSLYNLGHIMRNHPEFAPEIKQLAKEDFYSAEKDSYILTAKFRFMGNLVKAEPQSAPKVIKEVENLMESYQNNKYSYRAAFDTLAEIIKVDPEEFGWQAFDLVYDSFKNPGSPDFEDVEEDKLDRAAEAHEFAGKVFKTNPEFASDAFSMIALGKRTWKKYQEIPDILGMGDFPKTIERDFDTLAQIVELDPENFGQRAYWLLNDCFDSSYAFWREKDDNNVIEAFKFAGKLIKTCPGFAWDVSSVVYEYVEKDDFSHIKTVDVGKAAAETLKIIEEVNPDYAAKGTSRLLERLDEKVRKLEEGEIKEEVVHKKIRKARIKRNRAEDDEALNANVVGVEINPDKQGLINSAKERITAAKTAKTTEEPEKPTPSNGGNVPPVNNGNDGR